MAALFLHVLALPALGLAVVVFGFAPGAVLRLIVLCYTRDNPRRQELLGELYGVPRIERPFWVAEQLEVALFEGLHGRLAARRIRRRSEQDTAGHKDAVSQLVRDLRLRLGGIIAALVAAGLSLGAIWAKFPSALGDFLVAASFGCLVFAWSLFITDGLRRRGKSNRNGSAN